MYQNSLCATSATNILQKSELRSSALPYSPTFRCHVDLSGWSRYSHSPCTFHSTGPLSSIHVARSNWVPNRKSDLRNLGPSQRSTNFLAAPLCSPKPAAVLRYSAHEKPKIVENVIASVCYGVERGGSDIIYR